MKNKSSSDLIAESLLFTVSMTMNIKRELINFGTNPKSIKKLINNLFFENKFLAFIIQNSHKKKICHKFIINISYTNQNFSKYSHIGSILICLRNKKKKNLF